MHIHKKYKTDYRTQVSLVRSMGSSLSEVSEPLCADLTDVTLADEDTNPVLTDDANRTIQSNVAMQVTQPGGQFWNQTMHETLPGGQVWNQCKWCHLVAKFVTNASGAIWWLNLQLK